MVTLPAASRVLQSMSTQATVFQLQYSLHSSFCDFTQQT
jgi:hypothetical protein